MRGRYKRRTIAGWGSRKRGVQGGLSVGMSLWRERENSPSETGRKGGDVGKVLGGWRTGNSLEVE